MGPDLWKMVYDGVLRLPMPEGVTLVGFAVYLAIVVVAKLTEELMHLANEPIEAVGRWL